MVERFKKGNHVKLNFRPGSTRITCKGFDPKGYPFWLEMKYFAAEPFLGLVMSVDEESDTCMVYCYGDRKKYEFECGDLLRARAKDAD